MVTLPLYYKKPPSSLATLSLAYHINHHVLHPIHYQFPTVPRLPHKALLLVPQIPPPVYVAPPLIDPEPPPFPQILTYNHNIQPIDTVTRNIPSYDLSITFSATHATPHLILARPHVRYTLRPRGSDVLLQVQVCLHLSLQVFHGYVLFKNHIPYSFVVR